MEGYKRLLLGRTFTLQRSKRLFPVLVISMSRPPHLLQNPNLDEMPVTRSQSQRSSSGMDTHGLGRGRMDPLTGQTPSASRSGGSQRPAVASSFPPTAPQPAPTVRLAPYISVDHLQYISQDRSRGSPLGDDSYYAIQLNPVSVRIHDPAGGVGRVECTCPGFQSTMSPCAHMHVS